MSAHRPRDINLLPVGRRRLLRRQATIHRFEKAFRYILMGFLLLTILASGGALLLRFLLAVRSDSQSDTILLERVDEYRMIRNQVNDYNDLLGLMDAVGKKSIVWSDYLQEVFDLMPPGTSIADISARNDAVSHLVISGQVVSRSALIVLEERFRGLDWVADVQFPPSNLLQRTEAPYTFTLVINHSEIPNP